MGTPALAAVLVAVGIATALIGLVISVLMSRRRQVSESGPTVHTDTGLVVLVTGLIVSIFGAGDWTFLVLVP